MERTVNLYRGTNFNSINIPLDASVLGTPYASFYVNIVSAYEEPSVSLPGKEQDFWACDYVSISAAGDLGPAYYFVSGYVMTDENTCRLFLLPDYVLDAGGLYNLVPISGILTRSTHIRPDDENYLNIVDPYFIMGHKPIIKFESAWNREDYPEVGNEWYYVVASTIDLARVEVDQKIYEVNDTGEVNITVSAPMVGNYTRATTVASGLPEIASTTTTQGYALFRYSVPQIQDAISYLHKIGMSDAILGMYKLPARLFQFQENSSGFISNIALKLSEASYAIKASKPADLYPDNNSPLAAYHSGNYNIHLSSVGTGASMDINMAVTEPNRQDGYVYVHLLADPRYEGCVYFCVPPVASKSGTPGKKLETAKMPFGLLRGGNWDKAPLVFGQKAGSELALANVVSQETYKTLVNESSLRLGAGAVDVAGAAMAGAGAINSAAGIGMGTISLGEMGGIGWRTGAAQAGASLGGQVRNKLGDAYAAYALPAMGNTDPAEYYAASQSARVAIDQGYRRSRERARIYAEYRCVAPTVRIQPAENLQSMVGNGVCIMTVAPAKADLNAYLEICDKFGAPCNRALGGWSFPDGEDFWYFEAKGITLRGYVNAPYGGSITRRILEACEGVLSGGIRVWRTRPR